MKLHLGCWHRYIPGFIHIDLCDMEHIDYQTNIDDLSMFEDSSVSLIYASHCLQYFTYNDAIKVLKEWNRVLKKGGILRISVPDLQKLIQVYSKTNDIKTIFGPLYGHMQIKISSKESSLTDKFLYHKAIYDLQSITTLLKKLNFKNIDCYDWRETIHKDYDDHSQAYFPHMDKVNGILISLNLEATKK